MRVENPCALPRACTLTDAANPDTTQDGQTVCLHVDGRRASGEEDRQPRACSLTGGRKSEYSAGRDTSQDGTIYKVAQTERRRRDRNANGFRADIGTGILRAMSKAYKGDTAMRMQFLNDWTFLKEGTGNPRYPAARCNAFGAADGRRGAFWKFRTILGFFARRRRTFVRKMRRPSALNCPFRVYAPSFFGFAGRARSICSRSVLIEILMRAKGRRRKTDRPL